MTTEEKNIEEEQKVQHEKKSSDDDHEQLKHEEGDHQHGKSNRNEKKFKKAMGKLGLKEVTGINRVTIKNGKNFLISIDSPDIWRSPSGDHVYVVYGKPNMDGFHTGENQISQFKSPVAAQVPVQVKPEKTQEKPLEKESEQAKEEPEDLSEEGLSAQNIKMVMETVKCSKAQAIKALRQTDNDPINAVFKFAK